MSGNYTLNTKQLTSRPRSKRLRELGASVINNYGGASYTTGNYLPRVEFDDMFEWVTQNNGVRVIKAKATVVSVGNLVALYKGDDVPTQNVGLDLAALESYLTDNEYITKDWVLNQGFITALTGYATESWVNSQGFLKQHQSLANYVTLDAPQTIAGQKTFTQEIHAVADGGIYSDPAIGIACGFKTPNPIAAGSFIKSGGMFSQFLMADGSVVSKTSATSVSSLGWTGISADSQRIPDFTMLAYWNGAYADTYSNLAYCNKGAFGDMATKSAADFVTRATAQYISGRKCFIGGFDILFNYDSSNYIQFCWLATDGTTVKQSIGAHNTANRIFLNPCGSTDVWADAAGKYSLRIGVNELTYNTWDILHSGNYASILDTRYIKKSGDTMSGQLNFSAYYHLIDAKYNLEGSYSNVLFVDPSTNRVIYGSPLWAKVVLETSASCAYRQTSGVEYKIWDAGNMGPGSDLNADLLDGYHGSDYLRSFWTNTPGFDCASFNNSSLVSFTYGNNAPFSGGFIDVSTIQYGFYLGTSYLSDGPLYYRRHGHSADCGMGAWQQLARITDNVASATNADMLDGFHEYSFLRYRGALSSATTAISGIGTYGWATATGGFGSTYGDSLVIQGYSTWYNRLDFRTDGRIDFWQAINPASQTGAMSRIGTLAYLTDNVASATRLQGTFSLWGQSFYGNDVSGKLSNVTEIDMYGGIVSGGQTSGVYLGCAAAGLGAGHNGGLFYSYGNSPLYFCTNNLQRMRIDGNGTINVSSLMKFANGQEIYCPEGEFAINGDSATRWVTIKGGYVGIGTTNPQYLLDVYGPIRTTDWIYTYGNNGWYNETYGGGWWMKDSIYIRNYNSKRLLIEGINDHSAIVLTSGGISFDGYGGDAWNTGYGAINVGIANNGNQTTLLKAYRSGVGYEGANRLFAMELLNTGTELNFGFGGTRKFAMYNNGDFCAEGNVYARGGRIYLTDSVWIEYDPVKDVILSNRTFASKGDITALAS